MYESVIVMHPRLSDGEVAEFSESMKELITKGGGEVLSEDKWGRRKLAYMIGSSREGYYLYFKFNVAGSFIQKLNQYCKVKEDVLRALTVHVEEVKSLPPRKPRKIVAAATAPPAATTAS